MTTTDTTWIAAGADAVQRHALQGGWRYTRTIIDRFTPTQIVCTDGSRYHIRNLKRVGGKRGEVLLDPTAPYPNTVSGGVWSIIGCDAPSGKAFDYWSALLAKYPELFGARIHARPLHPDTGADVLLDIELERSMGPSLRRDDTVRRIGASFEAEIDPGLTGVMGAWAAASEDSEKASTLARWWTPDGICVCLHTTLCSCHAETVHS